MCKLLSVIIPAYNEEAMIMKTTSVIHMLLKEAKIEHEIVFVDDGSSDRTWRDIEKVVRNCSFVRGIRFSRNFGKESAIYAGFYYAKGDACVVIDCDLQHPPEKIVDMYRKWQEGYEIVEAVKSDRGDESWFHAFSARIFYEIISKIMKIDMKRTSDFKLLDRKAVTVLLNMKEKNSFFRALSSWIGFKSTQIEFEVQERTEGESKWSTWSLIKYAISNIASFSTTPMQIVTILGVIMFLISFVIGGIALYQKIAGIALDGFTTVIMIQLFSSSIVMVSLGVIGYYISKIYEEVKERPKFIVTEECGMERVND